MLPLTVTEEMERRAEDRAALRAGAADHDIGSPAHLAEGDAADRPKGADRAGLEAIASGQASLEHGRADADARGDLPGVIGMAAAHRAGDRDAGNLAKRGDRGVRRGCRNR